MTKIKERIKKVLCLDIPRSERKIRRACRINSRIWELDFIRGICMLLMVFDHFLVAVSSIFATAWAKKEFALDFIDFTSEYFAGELRAVVRPAVVFLFIFICGISCTFSKNNLKRGLLMAVVASLITAVTYALGKRLAIYFGFLHMLALGVLIYAIIQILCRKKQVFAAIISLLVGAGILTTYLCFENYGYPPPTGGFLGIFYYDDIFRHISPGDYAPFLSHAGSLFLGAAFGSLFYFRRKSLLPFLDPKFKESIEYNGKSIDKKVRWYRPVNFVGRHGLFVYALHQVVIVVILALVSMTAIGSFVIV